MPPLSRLRPYSRTTRIRSRERPRSNVNSKVGKREGNLFRRNISRTVCLLSSPSFLLSHPSVPRRRRRRRRRFVLSSEDRRRSRRGHHRDSEHVSSPPIYCTFFDRSASPKSLRIPLLNRKNQTHGLQPPPFLPAPRPLFFLSPTAVNKVSNIPFDRTTIAPDDEQVRDKSPETHSFSRPQVHICIHSLTHSFSLSLL